MKYTIAQYKQAAATIFEALISHPDSQNCNQKDSSIFSSCNYWQVGNVVDTMFDYMQMAINDPGSGMTPAKAQAYAASIYQLYQNLTATSNGCWYDDFGWWGIAAAKAYDPSYNNVFGTLVPMFRQAAVDCWNVMQTGKNNGRNFGAPAVWDKCDQATFATASPRYPGGVWQYDIFACPIAADCSFNQKTGSTPIVVMCGSDKLPPVTLGPYQLSVVNGLYLVLATKLATAGAIQPVFSQNVYSFIIDWCAKETGDNSLLNRYGTQNAGLIRERVSRYKDGSDVAYYDPANAWCGDQGLFLGGMVDYYLANKTPDAIVLASLILNGVRTQMQVMPADGMNVIAPFVPYEDALVPFQNDFPDYSSGLGVFMRYLYYSYNRNVDVRRIAGTTAYRQAITNTADAAYDNKFPTRSDDVNIFVAFNRLATLMMGIALGTIADTEMVDTDEEAVVRGEAL